MCMLYQGSPTSGLQNSLGLSGTGPHNRRWARIIPNHLPHPPPRPWKKMSSTKPVPSDKKVGDHCSYTFWYCPTILGCSRALSLFCLFVFQFVKFLYPIFKLTESFPDCTESTDESIKAILHFCYSSRTSFWFILRVSISLLTVFVCYWCCLLFPLKPITC